MRSRVHEYGGGAYLPTELGVFFVSGDDQNVHLAVTDGAGGYRISALTERRARASATAICAWTGRAGG